jgi:hypothetical protein
MGPPSWLPSPAQSPQTPRVLKFGLQRHDLVVGRSATPGAGIAVEGVPLVNEQRYMNTKTVMIGNYVDGVLTTQA